METLFGRAVLWVVAAVIGLVLAPVAQAGRPPLSQKGRWITDAVGRVVILHGVNMVYKRPPYAPEVTGFGADDVQFLRRNGFNTVRLGVIYKGVEPTVGAYDNAYLDRIAQTARQLSRGRIFFLLDFHQDLYNERFGGEGFPDWAVDDDGLPAQPNVGFPGNYPAMPALSRAFDHFWANDPAPGRIERLQARYGAGWRHVAARFRNDPYLMGYDILNEPWPGSVWPSCANPAGCPLFDANQLTAMSRRVTNRIREVDQRKVVWYEPNVIFNFGAQTHHGDMGPRAGMSFHVYCLQETPEPNPLDPLQQESCSVGEELAFENADAQSARTGDGLLVSEFGATDDLGDIERVIELADEHMVGWQYWHYCTCRDPTTSGTGGTQALVIDPAKPPTGGNVKQAKLSVLSRPYPQAVAGIPEDYSFDPQTRRFRLDYTTGRLGGGGFPFGADTWAFIPRRHYPGGYDVTVKGGEALSKPNAENLTIRACAGRARVEVTVVSGTGRRLADCRAPRSRRRKVGPRRRPGGGSIFQSNQGYQRG